MNPSECYPQGPQRQEGRAVHALGCQQGHWPRTTPGRGHGKRGPRQTGFHQTSTDPRPTPPDDQRRFPPCARNTGNRRGTLSGKQSPHPLPQAGVSHQNSATNRWPPGTIERTWLTDHLLPTTAPSDLNRPRFYPFGTGKYLDVSLMTFLTRIIVTQTSESRKNAPVDGGLVGRVHSITTANDGQRCANRHRDAPRIRRQRRRPPGAKPVSTVSPRSTGASA